MANARCSIVTTPNPNERAVALLVPYDLIARNEAAMPVAGTTTAAGTAYGANQLCNLVDKSYLQAYGLYQYTYSEDKPVEGGQLLYFAKPRTDEERNTPYNFIPGEMVLSWPAVLQGYTVGLFNDNTDFVAVVPSKFPKRNNYTGLTDVRIDQYLSERPWPQSRFGLVSLAPTGFSWDALVNSDRVDQCLHPGIGSPSPTFPSTHPRYPNVTVPGIAIFATNETDWVDTVIKLDPPSRQDGLYLLEEMTAFAPNLPTMV